MEQVHLREKCSNSEFFWSVFSRIRIEYGEIRDIFPYSVQMRENTEQKNSEYGHFLPSGSMKSFIEYVRKMFRKIHISYPLIRKILENSAHVLNG